MLSEIREEGETVPSISRLLQIASEPVDWRVASNNGKTSTDALIVSLLVAVFWATIEMKETSDAQPGDVSIVIVTYNSAQVMARCLESLKSTLGEFPGEMVIVDNNSSDQTISIAERLSFGSTRILVNTKNEGFAKACNQGFRESSRKYVCFLNPDVYVKPDWLQPLVRVLAQDWRVAAVVPRLYWLGGALDAVGAFVRYPPPKVQPLFYRGAEDIEVGLVGFACVLIPRRILENFPLDERMFLYNEDIDFCMRVKSAGHKLILCPHSRATHVGGHSKPTRFLQLRSEAYFNRTILKCAPLKLAAKGLFFDLVGLAAGIKNRNPWYAYQKAYAFFWTILNVPIAERIRTRASSKAERASLPLVESSFSRQRQDPDVNNPSEAARPLLSP